MFLQVAHQLGINDESLKDLIISAKSLPSISENLDLYQKTINPLFVEKKDEISGLTYDVFETSALNSMTVVELRSFAKENQLIVPNGFLKHEILEKVKKEAYQKYPFNKPLINGELDKVTIIELKRYAINEKLDVVFDLKKESIIDIILEGYKKYQFDSTVEEISFNLPPRNVIKTNQKINDSNTPYENIDIEIEESQTTSKIIDNNKPININIYYDGIRQVEDKSINSSNNSNKIIEKETKVEKINKKTSLWLLIVYIILGTIIGTFLYVIILDTLGIIPHDSNPISKFIYGLIFGK